MRLVRETTEISHPDAPLIIGWNSGEDSLMGPWRPEMINAVPDSVTVVLDEGIAAAGRINVHPLRNTGTLGLAGKDVASLLKHWGHAPIIAAIPTKETAP